MKKIIFFVSASLLMLLLAGCTSDRTVPESDLKIAEECVNLCQAELQKGTDLSNGPCIGNPLSSNIEWVCDVAHDPRQPIDDKPENQCSAFREGKAAHFIEVNESCKVIKEY